MNNKLVVVAVGARKLDRLLVAALLEHPYPQIEAEPLVAAVARGAV
jgi:hypothetical protein